MTGFFKNLFLGSGTLPSLERDIATLRTGFEWDSHCYHTVLSAGHVAWLNTSTVFLNCEGAHLGVKLQLSWNGFSYIKLSSAPSSLLEFPHVLVNCS